MGTEIERKFLAKPGCIVEYNLEAVPHRLIQGYLSMDPAVRVRLDTTAKKGYLTIKGKGLIQRLEYEYDIPKDDAEDMLKMCAFSLSKDRYTVNYHGKEWVIDHIWWPYTGVNLWLTEIELDSVDKPFDMAPWALEDVSEDPRYKNATLAKNGPPINLVQLSS